MAGNYPCSRGHTHATSFFIFLYVPDAHRGSHWCATVLHDTEKMWDSSVLQLDEVAIFIFQALFFLGVCIRYKYIYINVYMKYSVVSGRSDMSHDPCSAEGAAPCSSNFDSKWMMFVKVESLQDDLKFTHEVSHCPWTYRYFNLYTIKLIRCICDVNEVYTIDLYMSFASSMPVKPINIFTVYMTYILGYMHSYT